MSVSGRRDASPEPIVSGSSQRVPVKSPGSRPGLWKPNTVVPTSVRQRLQQARSTVTRPRAWGLPRAIVKVFPPKLRRQLLPKRHLRRQARDWRFRILSRRPATGEARTSGRTIAPVHGRRQHSNVFGGRTAATLRSLSISLSCHRRTVTTTFRE